MPIFRPRSDSTPPPAFTTGGGFSPPLLIVQFIATHKGDAERGPEVRMQSREAAIRLLSDGELARVETPRRQEIATIRIDDHIGAGEAVVRDIFGVTLSEVVRVRKIDLDTPTRHFG